MKTITLGLLLAAAAVSSFAAPVTYNTHLDWAAPGSVNPVVIDFEGIAAGSSQSSFALTDTTFSALTGNLIVYSAGNWFTDLNDGKTLTGANGGILISPLTTIYGFGFIIGSATGTPVSVLVNGTDTYQIAAPTNPPATGGNPAVFWGLRSDVAITSIQLMTDTAGYRVFIDNFTTSGLVNGGGDPDPPVDPPTETPEASSALLIGGSLLLLPLARKYVAGKKSVAA